MKKARVWLSWTPSISNDVVNVDVKVTANEELVFNQVVTPDISEVEVGVFNEGDRLEAEVFVSDGTNTSVKVVTHMTVPDLTEPSPVTELGFRFSVEEE